jgi:5-methyltetrahydrofolate corrinoid/iron sulfur protein methyltransferase
MIVIGERINGMFKVIKEAIVNNDKKPVQDMALKQIEAGATMLDINVGPTSAEPEKTMAWLVEAVQEVTDMALSIDSPKFPVMKAGLKACKNKKLINSTTGKDEDLAKFMPLAVEHDADIIGLTIDENGVPNSAEGRSEIALKILSVAMENGIDPTKLFIDPIVLPVKADQKSPGFVLEAIKQFTMLCDPPPHIVVGLSNLSQTAIDRKIINRTFLAMGIANGLDAAIADPLDTDLMDAMITAELLMNKTIYSDSFLKAYRSM